MDKIVRTWRDFLETNKNFQTLLAGVSPKVTPNGRIYELPNYLGRDGESFAIADMSDISVAEPHYHPDDNWEVYYILHGKGCVVVGSKEQNVVAGDVVVIKPNIAHYTIPGNNFVMGIVSTPPFDPDTYILLHESNPRVQYDAEQFKRHVENRTRQEAKV